MGPKNSSGSARMSLDNVLERIGMSPDKFHEDFEKYAANSRWFEEHASEIRKKYGGRPIIIADETVYPVGHINNYDSVLTELNEKGVNVDAALKIVVPKEGEIPPIRFGPLYYSSN